MIIELESDENTKAVSSNELYKNSDVNFVSNERNIAIEIFKTAESFNLEIQQFSSVAKNDFKFNKNIKFVAKSIMNAYVSQNDNTFDKEDTKSKVFRNVIDNNKTLTKNCSDVKMDTKMTLYFKYYTILIKNIESFERGNNIIKTTKKLDENTEKNLKVKHQYQFSKMRIESKKRMQK